MGLSPLASLLAAGAVAVIGILTAGVAPAAAGPVRSVECASNIRFITMSAGVPGQQRFLAIEDPGAPSENPDGIAVEPFGALQPPRIGVPEPPAGGRRPA